MDFHGCRNLNITGCQIQAARTRGIRLSDCHVARITDCTIRSRDGDGTYVEPIAIDAGSEQIMILNNFLAKGSAGQSLPERKSTAIGGNVWT